MLDERVIIYLVNLLAFLICPSGFVPERRNDSPRCSDRLLGLAKVTFSLPVMFILTIYIVFWEERIEVASQQILVSSA